MPRAFRLGYVDLQTPSLEAALYYYRDMLGAGEAHATSRSAFLSLGPDHHTLALHAADSAGLGAIGLQVEAGALDALEIRLRGLGLDPVRKADARPGVPHLLEIADVAGHRFQLFDGMSLEGPGFTGVGVAPLRLGHVAVLTPDAARLTAFLVAGLGFWITDWFEDVATFVTCNRDHHVLNLVQAPFATLHHLAFQLADRGSHIQAADTLVAGDRPILWGPARHTAGHNVASYHYGADDALIELYTDMDVFVPELGRCEPRPWHADRPQTPKRWSLSQMSRWDTAYEFNLAAVAFGKSHEGTVRSNVPAGLIDPDPRS